MAYGCGEQWHIRQCTTASSSRNGERLTHLTGVETSFCMGSHARSGGRIALWYNRQRLLYSVAGPVIRTRSSVTASRGTVDGIIFITADETLARTSVPFAALGRPRWATPPPRELWEVADRHHTGITARPDTQPTAKISQREVAMGNDRQASGGALSFQADPFIRTRSESRNVHRRLGFFPRSFARGVWYVPM